MKKPSVAAMVARYSGIILLLPSCLILGYLGGSWLDEHWETEPVFTLAGFLLGSAAGLLQVFRMLHNKP